MAKKIVCRINQEMFNLKHTFGWGRERRRREKRKGRESTLWAMGGKYWRMIKHKTYELIKLVSEYFKTYLPSFWSEFKQIKLLFLTNSLGTNPCYLGEWALCKPKLNQSHICEVLPCSFKNKYSIHPKSQVWFFDASIVYGAQQIQHFDLGFRNLVKNTFSLVHIDSFASSTGMIISSPSKAHFIPKHFMYLKWSTV